MASPSCMTYVCLFILCALEKELSQAFGTHNNAAALLIRNMAEKALYLQRKSVWHQLRWYKCPILGPVMVTLNARSVSNQGVCGSVGEKQKVQMQPWVLAHSHHVSHEIKRRNHSLCAGVWSILISAFLRLVYVTLEGECASKYGEENHIERDGKRGREREEQTHKHTFPALLTHHDLKTQS